MRDILINDDMKVPRIVDSPDEMDFTSQFCSIGNQKYIPELVMRFGLSSAYPQKKLLEIDFPHASALVKIEDTDVHVVLHWGKKKEFVYHMWIYPDTPEFVKKFQGIWEFLLDFRKMKSRNK